jgi:hypothetical protein
MQRAKHNKRQLRTHENEKRALPLNSQARVQQQHVSKPSTSLHAHTHKTKRHK